VAGGALALVVLVSAAVGAGAAGDVGSSDSDSLDAGPAAVSAPASTPAPSQVPAASAAARTRLTIVYRPHGGGDPGAGVTHQWTLTCNPTGGTLPSRTEACRELAVHGNDLIHTGVQCMVIVLHGPMATVNGTWDGRRVQYVSSTCSRAWSTLGAVLTGSA